MIINGFSKKKLEIFEIFIQFCNDNQNEEDFLSVNTAKTRAFSLQTHQPTDFDLFPKEKLQSLDFYPPKLEFGDVPICSLSKKNITISNSETIPFIIFSIATDSPHIHPYIKHDRKAATKGNNVTICVVLLPTSLGIIEGTMVISTNVGKIQYKFYGNTVESPYELDTIVNHALFLGKPYKKTIQLFNPSYSEPLIIKDVFTLEKELHLAIPKSSQDGSGDSWRIPPRSSRDVITIEFNATNLGKFQGFVHIKAQEYLRFVISVEFFVSNSGIYPITEEIDFGVLTSPLDIHSASLVLANTLPKAVSIQEIFTTVPDPLLMISGYNKGFVLEANKQPLGTKIATISYLGKSEGKFQGKLMIRTNESNPIFSIIEVSYTAKVVYGVLEYFHNITGFYVTKDRVMQKQFTLNPISFINRFSVPVEFQSAKVGDTERLEVVGFEPGSIVKPNEERKNLFSVLFKPNETNLILRSHLEVITNVTRMLIPINSFHGMLSYVPFNQQQQKEQIFPSIIESNGIYDKVMHCGVLQQNKEHVFYFYLHNPNPIHLAIDSFGIEQPQNPQISQINSEGKVEIVSISQHIEAVPFNNHNYIEYISIPDEQGPKHSQIHNKIFLNPNDRILFKYTLSIPKTTANLNDSPFSQIFFLKTDYSKFRMEIKYFSMPGSLYFQPDLVFGKAFPGLITRKPLFAVNTFERPVTVKDVVCNDSRFSVILKKKTIPPNQKAKIGFVVFNPANTTDQELLYMKKTSIGQYWLGIGPDGFPEQISPSGNEIPTQNLQNIATNNIFSNKKKRIRVRPINAEEVDQYRERNYIFEEIRNKKKDSITAGLTITTDLYQKHQILLQANLTIPRLQPLNSISKPNHQNQQDETINFGLTQIHGFSEKYIDIFNPSDHPIGVHLLIGDDSLHKLLNKRKTTQKKLDANDSDSFFSAQDSNSAKGKEKELISVFKLGNGTNSAIIPPNKHFKLGPVLFFPKKLGTFRATLYLRNNLTLFDVFQLVGRGGTAKLCFFSEKGDKKMKNEILFQIREEEFGLTANSMKIMSRQQIREKIDNFLTNYSKSQQLPPKKSRFSNKPCEKPTEIDIKKVIFRRKFILKNTGSLPITISHSRIEGRGCSAYGVTITDCNKPVVLNQGQTADFEIVFTPDFTTSRISLKIVLTTTNQGEKSIPLNIVIPKQLLPFLYNHRKRIPSAKIGGIEFGIELIKTVATFTVLITAFYVAIRTFLEKRSFGEYIFESPASEAEIATNLNQVSVSVSKTEEKNVEELKPKNVVKIAETPIMKIELKEKEKDKIEEIIEPQKQIICENFEKTDEIVEKTQIIEKEKENLNIEHVPEIVNLENSTIPSPPQPQQKEKEKEKKKSNSNKQKKKNKHKNLVENSPQIQSPKQTTPSKDQTIEKQAKTSPKNAILEEIPLIPSIPTKKIEVSDQILNKTTSNSPRKKQLKQQISDIKPKNSPNSSKSESPNSKPESPISNSPRSSTSKPESPRNRSGSTSSNSSSASSSSNITTIDNNLASNTTILTNSQSLPSSPVVSKLTTTISPLIVESVPTTDINSIFQQQKSIVNNQKRNLKVNNQEKKNESPKLQSAQSQLKNSQRRMKKKVYVEVPIPNPNEQKFQTPQTQTNYPIFGSNNQNIFTQNSISSKDDEIFDESLPNFMNFDMEDEQDEEDNLMFPSILTNELMSRQNQNPQNVNENEFENFFKPNLSIFDTKPSGVAPPNVAANKPQVVDPMVNFYLQQQMNLFAPSTQRVVQSPATPGASVGGQSPAPNQNVFSLFQTTSPFDSIFSNNQSQFFSHENHNNDNNSRDDMNGNKNTEEEENSKPFFNFY